METQNRKILKVETEHSLKAHAEEEQAAGRLFKAVVWGYLGSAAGLLALALLSLGGAHIHWVHLARGIVTGS
jgi:hypothetical protein